MVLQADRRSTPRVLGKLAFDLVQMSLVGPVPAGFSVREDAWDFGLSGEEAGAQRMVATLVVSR